MVIILNFLKPTSYCFGMWKREAEKCFMETLL